MGQQPFYRDTWAEVNLDHIFYNVQSLKKILPEDVKIFAVVKANAYGHGDVQVARTALKAGANFLAVATLDEAIALRQKGMTVPILVLGATPSKDAVLAAEYDITLTVFQLEWLLQANELLTEDKHLRVHLKIDTGMGRIGVKTGQEIKEIEAYIREAWSTSLHCSDATIGRRNETKDFYPSRGSPQERSELEYMGKAYFYW